MIRDPDIEEWVQRAKAADILEVAQRIVPDLKKAGHDWNAACPMCGGKDRNEFVVTPRKAVFLCRKSGEGGGVISMVRHALGLKFFGACEEITGEPCPRPDKRSEPRPIDHSVTRERDDERADDEASRARADEDRRSRSSREAEAIFESALPIAGTMADAYLRARRIVALPECLADLRFVPALPYHGWADADSTELVDLGSFPAMVGAIRDVDGHLIGIHRTYLDPQRAAKLKPPGDRTRNRAKKMFGSKKGGLIRLGPIRPCMAIGEGIETTLSWMQFGIGPDEVGIAAAGDLGNLSGGATGSIQHPTYARRTIPNGEPNMSEPGMVLPPEVQEIILLGDRDEHEANVRAHLLVAGRRFAAMGLTVTVHMAPEKPKGRQKWDWNDALMAGGEAP